MTSTPVLDILNFAFVPVQCLSQWNTIMTHRAGNAHFEDTWDALLVGFNNDSVGEYYIGNHALKYLIGKGDFILRLDMWSADGGYITAEYSGLSMKSEANKFALSLENYDSGTTSPGGLVRYLSGSAFSTHDDDSSANNCTQVDPSAWWYQQNPTVALPDGDSSECFTSQLTSESSMTWAHEDKDGVIRGHAPIDQVVMRLHLNPESTFRKYRKLRHPSPCW